MDLDKSSRMVSFRFGLMLFRSYFYCNACLMNKWIFVFALFTMAQWASATNGDTTVVTSHNNVLVVTNPGAGWNEYRQWADFPAAGTDYRKVWVKMSYECPTGQNCGEWDYIDQIWLRRQGSVDSVSMDLEMVRFITPYGNSFTGLWNFQWTMDISDFASFLHDSIEIGYVHTGYETNVGRGWMVTLEFFMVEGTPVSDFISLSPLWNGSYTYGNAADPIENHLVNVNKSFASNAARAHLRINHTGHGSDNNGCSEFCNAYRDLYYDGNFVERIQRWRTCGDNALYPQAGTWVYDRGNWCPGAVVYPYQKDFDVAANSSHSFDIDMEAYTITSPSGNEYVVGYLFEYAAPNAAVDASIEEILEPNDMKQFSRHNPICAEPRIVIRNNGSQNLSSATIAYGFNNQPQFNYNWSGNLSFGESDTVTLPGTLVAQSGQTTFTATLLNPNGTSDEYPLDNSHSANAVIPPSYNVNTIVVEFKSNNEPQDNAYRLLDENNNVILERTQGSMAANITYKDTLVLSNGCYRLIVDDIKDGGGDGLAFWANNNDGSGYVRLRSLNNILKSFSADFGSLIDYSFTLGSVFTSTANIEQQVDIVIFPNPNSGVFSIDFASNSNGIAQVEIYDLKGSKIMGENYAYSQNTRQTIDMSSQPNGIYLVKITGEFGMKMQKVVLSR